MTGREAGMGEGGGWRGEKAPPVAERQRWGNKLGSTRSAAGCIKGHWTFRAEEKETQAVLTSLRFWASPSSPVKQDSQHSIV